MKFWNFIKTFGAIIGLISSIITIIVFAIPRDKQPELSVFIQSIENLAINSVNKSEPDIVAQYYYKKVPISNLWKISIRIQNTSSKTLVGIGSQKNIVYDSLTILFTKKAKLLESKLINSNFDHRFVKSSNSFSFKFEQFRENEYLDYCFYYQIDSTATKLDTIIYLPANRQIIDGNIKVLFEVNEKKTLITEYIPKSIRRVAYVMTMIILGISILVVLIFIFSSIYGFYVRKIWYKKFGRQFYDFIKINKKKFKNSSLSLEKLYKNPDQIYPIEWNDFEGEKYNNIGLDFNIDNILTFALIQIIFLFFTFANLIVFIDLIQFFP